MARELVGVEARLERGLATVEEGGEGVFRGELVRGGNGGNGEAAARGEQGVLGSGSRRTSR